MSRVPRKDRPVVADAPKSTGPELTLASNDAPGNGQSDAMLVAVVEPFSNGEASTDLKGFITGWNESAERIFGYRANDAIGKSITITLCPDRVEGQIQPLPRRRRGTPADHDDKLTRQKQSPGIRLSVTISPTTNRNPRNDDGLKICRDVVKRLEAAAEVLRAGEPHFRDTFRQISDYAIFNMTPGGAIKTWNKGCRQILGYDEAEFLKMNGEQLFVAEDKAAGIPAQELQIAADKISAHEDRWMLRKNGERFWASGTTTALRDDHGGLIGFAKVMRDLTRERRMQEETKLNVERLRFLSETTRSLLETRDPVELLNRIYDGLADTFGLQFYFHYLLEPNSRNMRLGAYRGISAEAARQIEILEFGNAVCGVVARDRKPIIVSDVQQSMDPMTQLIRNLGITAYACHPLIANSELLGTLSFGTTRFTRFAPELLSVIRALCDIVAVAIARKRAEQRLAERARLLDISRDAIIIRDLENRIVYWNHGAEVLFGWTQAEVLGQNPCHLLQSVLPVTLEELTEKFNRDDYWEGEIIQTARDGRKLVTAATGSMARDEKGRPLGILHTYTDITELKRVQRELADANKELGDRAANLELAVQERTAYLQETIAELEGVSYSLSHDMRAPLRAINSFSQIILAEAGERLGSLEKDLLEKNISAADRLDRLIRDVLIYTRVARGSVPLGSVDVERLLRQIIAERPELQLPRADIGIESPLGSVYGHEAYLTQCISNLLDNAVKFVSLGTQPRIRIRSEALNSDIRLWFEDNGIGVPSELQERIFGIFERAHDERTYPGTGIGLAIVRKAAERMGGSVGVESEPGKGSRFWLQLPNGQLFPNGAVNQLSNRRHFGWPITKVHQSR